MSVETDVAAAVAAAITELGHEYPSVSWEADGSGGAYITVGPVALGPQWRPSEAQITFQLAFYTDAFGLGTQLGLRASQAPTTGFRGFILSLVVSQPATVDGLIGAAL